MYLMLGQICFIKNAKQKNHKDRVIVEHRTPLIRGIMNSQLFLG